MSNQYFVDDCKKNFFFSNNSTSGLFRSEF